ncbi:hypothetical protein DQG13_10830 [Paenibacillus sp. YN15]|nr:hypothetical protein DQG13_10830 [Paenibacillus sp. YN15]
MIPFSQKQKSKDEAFDQAVQSIEKRFGVSFWEYMGLEGRTEEVQEKINRALRKETFQLASTYEKE